MAGRLSSKVVIVTGGSTGIGRAVADRIAAEGGAVVIAGRRPELGEQAAAALRARGGQARFVATDVTVEQEVRRLVEAAVAEFGRLDGALNNAGGVNATAPLPGVDAGTWHADLEQNLTSVFYCLKYALVTGNVDTPLYRDLIGAPPDGELPGPAANPTGRVATAGEIASYVAYLLSDEAAFIIGAALAIDGGATA
jgi:NAD(P)-dependent dehydrogenase (short-subunit alcohol dehydrogenase family)